MYYDLFDKIHLRSVNQEDKMEMEGIKEESHKAVDLVVVEGEEEDRDMVLTVTEVKEEGAKEELVTPLVL